MNKEIAIIGAGFSGMTLAWCLQRKGFKVEVYEKNPRPGGMLKTTQADGLLIESAANGLIWTDHVETLFREAGISMIFSKKESKARYIWRNRLRRWPLSIPETLAFVARLGPRMLSKKRMAPQSHQSISEWAEIHLGKPAAQFLVSPVLQGIYAGDVRRLSASLIFGRFFKGPRKSRVYKGTIAPAEGMEAMIRALETYLASKGVTFHYNQNVDLASLKKPFVLATSAPAAAQLLSSTAPEVAREIAQIEMIPLVSATVTYKNIKNPIRGFGVLVPQVFGLGVLGVLANNFIFEHRGDKYNETWIFGGAGNPRVTEMADDEIRAEIIKEREILLGEKVEVEHFHLTRWPQALPHYTVELEDRLKGLAGQKNIYLTGNYLGQLGLSRILERNLELAEELAHV